MEAKFQRPAFFLGQQPGPSRDVDPQHDQHQRPSRGSSPHTPSQKYSRSFQPLEKTTSIRSISARRVSSSASDSAWPFCSSAAASTSSKSPCRRDAIFLPCRCAASVWLYAATRPVRPRARRAPARSELQRARSRRWLWLVSFQCRSMTVLPFHGSFMSRAPVASTSTTNRVCFAPSLPGGTVVSIRSCGLPVPPRFAGTLSPRIFRGSN
mmetsp:Transcript_33893/g.71136  ORF Transcript_33893/g.71136 Transcript_33893/m.71136 type:complete len:210 (+) Transcript_33893:54-683(+)